MWELNNNLDVDYTSKSEKSWWLSTAVDDINSKLEWLKLKIPQIKEQETLSRIYKNKDFLKALKKGIFKEWIYVRYINDDLFWVSSKKTWEIAFFTNSLWEIVLNVSHRESLFIDEDWEYLKSSLKAFEEAWYFMDSKSWKRNIYKINWKNSNWEFIFEEKPLNKNSIEYFNALKEISKNYDIILLLIAIKDKIEIWKWNIDDFILSWALSIKFLLILQEKWLLESPELFEYWITKMWVKESDVIETYKNNQINKKQAYKIYKAMPEDMRNVTGKKKD